MITKQDFLPFPAEKLRNIHRNIHRILLSRWGFPGGSVAKNPPAIQEM